MDQNVFQQEMICPVCAAQVQYGREYCPFCQARLIPDIPQQMPPAVPYQPAALPMPAAPLQKPFPFRMFTGLVLCLTAVILCIVGAVRIKSDKLQRAVEVIRDCEEHTADLRKQKKESSYFASTYDLLIKEYNKMQKDAEETRDSVRTGALVFWLGGAAAAGAGIVFLFLSRKEESAWQW